MDMRHTIYNIARTVHETYLSTHMNLAYVQCLICMCMNTCILSSCYLKHVMHCI